MLLCGLLLSLSACTSGKAAPTEQTQPEGNPVVGICLPGARGQWQQQAQAFIDRLAQLQYDVLVEYADNDPQLQLSQVQAMVGKPVACLVVAAVDAPVLSTALDQAKNSGIRVLAYDRMLMYTDAVSACVAADSYGAGKKMAQYILDNAAPSAAQPRTVELFMGSPDDNNALLMHQGIMELLQPLLDSGALVCCSGRTTFEDTCVQGGDMQTALEHCFGYLSEIYTEAPPDILLCGTDDLAEGCIRALEEFAYTPGQQMIVAAELSEQAAERMEQGWLQMCIYGDAVRLADSAARLASQLLEDALPAGDTVRSNGVRDVPCILLEPVIADRDNYRQLLETVKTQTETLPDTEPTVATADLADMQ